MKRFSDAVARLFPTRVSKRLERFFQMSQRNAQYILAGRDDPSDDMVEALEDQIARMESIDLEANLRGLVDAARQARVHDEVIAALLAETHETVLGRTID